MSKIKYNDNKKVFWKGLKTLRVLKDYKIGEDIQIETWLLQDAQWFEMDSVGDQSSATPTKGLCEASQIGSTR